MNKIFDYMAGQRPTLIAVKAANNPISEADAGITVAPGCPSVLAAAIFKLSQLPPHRRAQMGLNGRRHVEANYSMAVLAERLAETLHHSTAEYQKAPLKTYRSQHERNISQRPSQF